jgi:hypothetical protein
MEIAFPAMRWPTGVLSPVRRAQMVKDSQGVGERSGLVADYSVLVAPDF